MRIFDASVQFKFFHLKSLSETYVEVVIYET